jgi:thioredoxin-like negative regulator of GroEL
MNLPEYHEIGLTAANFHSELEKELKLTLVHFFKDKKDDSWEEIHKTYKGIVLTARMDCRDEDNEELALELGVKRFPAIRVFPANRAKKSFNLVFDDHDDIVETLTKEMRHEI